MTWTDETIKAMIAMREQGYSATQIAASLGTTRNAVLGKIFRVKADGTEVSTRNRYYRRADQVSKGVLEGGTLMKTAIGFEPSVHEQIRELAIRNKQSFGEQVRQLVAVGLDVERLP